jgi:hypothetical protein
LFLFLLIKKLFQEKRNEMSFEEAFEKILIQKKINYENNTSSYDKPDFVIKTKSGFLLPIELKEKRQLYNLSSWKLEHKNNDDIFIIDELTIKNLINNYGLNFIIIIALSYKNPILYIPISGYHFLLLEKERCDRVINNSFIKGKWIIDILKFQKTDNILELLNMIKVIYKNFNILNKCKNCIELPNQKIYISGSKRYKSTMRKDALKK